MLMAYPATPIAKILEMCINCKGRATWSHKSGTRAGDPFFRNPEFFKDNAQGTEFCETILEEVGADKCGEKIPVWVYPGTQCQAGQNKGAGNYMNPVINYHCNPLD